MISPISPFFLSIFFVKDFQLGVFPAHLFSVRGRGLCKVSAFLTIVKSDND